MTYVFAGQSNMVGQPEGYVYNHPRLLNLRPFQRMAGPEMGFLEARPDAHVTKLATGGTGFSGRQPFWLPPDGELFVKLRDGVTPPVEAIVWAQGAADLREWEHYEARLLRFLVMLRGAWRWEGKAPPIVLVQSNDVASMGPGLQKIRAIQADLAKRFAPLIELVETDGLTTVDGAHFDAESLRELGRRIAAVAP